jgi:hypothetical protein
MSSYLWRHSSHSNSEFKIRKETLQIRVADPDPHYFKKLDPDPHLSQNSEASEAQNIPVDAKVPHNRDLEA